MAKCASCGVTLVLGGARDGDLRYCNGNCKKRGPLSLALETVPAELVQDWVTDVHQGPCPICGEMGNGPIDVHRSHRAWSFGWTFWYTNEQVSCRPCGQSERRQALAFSALLGWWGLPFGPILAPVQVVRNLTSLVRPPSHDFPSASLHEVGRLVLAEERAVAVTAGLPVSG